MVLKKHVGQNFIYRCSNGTLEQRGAKLYLLLFKWYVRTWGKTLFTAVQMVVKNNVGQNFIYLLFKWYLRTMWGKTLFPAVQMVF